MGAKLRRTGTRPTQVTKNCIRLVKELPEKHAKGAAQLASELAPRSTPETNPASAEPGYVHMADTIKAKRKGRGGERWEVEVGKDYAIYPEMGTIYQDAQPFFRPAMASAQRAMRREMRTVVKKSRHLIAGIKKASR